MLECLLCIALSPVFSSYANNEMAAVTDSFGFAASVGDPWSVWVEWENPELKIVGQDMADIDLISAGIGYDAKLTERLTWNIDVGYGWPRHEMSESDYNIQHEVVGTYLANVHSGGDRPAFYATNHNREYELEGGFLAGTGLDYAVHENFDIGVYYRWFRSKQTFRVCDYSTERCEYPNNLKWIQTDTLNLSRLSLRATFRF